MEKKYRVIFHIDLNAFFASCEMAEDPTLRDKAIGIGGSSNRGVLTTANYVARKYGVSSAMSVMEAKRLCPELIILPVNFDLYHTYSEKFFSVLSEYSDTIEKGSIDEGYLDMTALSETMHPLDIANEIQQRLLKEHNLPVSIGIAPNMFLAKMASDMKKPLGITILRKRDVSEKMWPLPIEKMFGIGKKTYPNLKLLGIRTIGDLAQYDDAYKLGLVLGNRVDEFQQKAFGHDDRTIEPDRYVDMKSIGNSQTYAQDLYEYQDIIGKLTDLTRKVVQRLQADESVAKTITIQVRYNDFTQINRSLTREHHTDSFYEILAIVERLYDENQSDKPIRLLGVSVSNLIDSEHFFRQLNIFQMTDITKKDEAVIRVLDDINEAYGQKIIKKGAKK
ncbi:DNA polymerase IV [Candidatus Xianfuyuplasma coldseepsis]|uniref:DNA polymerase IV n=1 Tax=Candidatus Xianfuyuplasma coldseepsis TaxID=2782163 RepID=A0A7L7KS90_9MOLU|nr:DNA polymerase IV [Xianfuyuplasma coldseepsis]QMS85690.1 DNA polymerase IV [Xianfuyuplasma coldseepsis]